MTFINSDAAAILSSINRHDKQLLVKRKFLMGLCDAPEFINDKKGSRAGNRQVSMLPETFLRKDDVFYEDLKELVEKGSEAYVTVIKQQDNVEIGDLKYVSSFVATSLDDFSNHGLCSLAKIVTRDSVKFYKTRTQMKKVIKKGLLDIHTNQCHSYQVKIHSELCQVLQNSKNFHHNHLPLTLKCHHAVVSNVLSELKDMSLQTLSAMLRKLRGIRGYVPQLHPPRSGWSKDRLIDQVVKLCSDMIQQLGESNELPEPLAKAMAVAGLSTRVANDCKDVHEANYAHVTPELEALQNEIVKAIWSLRQKVKKEEIKTLQQLLDPESKVDSKGLKTAIRNMLMEFLFECCDMEVIPDSLIKALSLINKTPCIVFSKDSAHEGVECILNVGAHLKQILWDYVPNYELDQDFADAYMEEPEESDDGNIFSDDDGGDDDNNKLQLHTDTLHQLDIRFNDFTEEVQSTGDPELGSFKSEGDSENTNESSSSSFGATTFGDDVECPNTVEMLVSASSQSESSPFGSPMSLKSANFPDGQDSKGDFSVVSTSFGDSSLNILRSEQIPMPQKKNIARNQFISLQEVSDRASVVAYHLTGYLLKGLDSPSDPTDKGDGDPLIVQATRQVIPLFPNSEMETVKKFMSF